MSMTRSHITDTNISNYIEEGLSKSTSVITTMLCHVGHTLYGNTIPRP